ncbi:MAG: hypothetical protein JXR97_10850 [Planctomycetes bacterium]|nr:hypothetical protein [Planctomycetota bacterium]
MAEFKPSDFQEAGCLVVETALNNMNLPEEMRGTIFKDIAEESGQPIEIVQLAGIFGFMCLDKAADFLSGTIKLNDALSIIPSNGASRIPKLNIFKFTLDQMEYSSPDTVKEREDRWIRFREGLGFEDPDDLKWKTTSFLLMAGRVVIREIEYGSTEDEVQKFLEGIEKDKDKRCKIVEFFRVCLKAAESVWNGEDPDEAMNKHKQIMDFPTFGPLFFTELCAEPIPSVHLRILGALPSTLSSEVPQAANQGSNAEGLNIIERVILERFREICLIPVSATFPHLLVSQERPAALVYGASLVAQMLAFGSPESDAKEFISNYLGIAPSVSEENNTNAKTAGIIINLAKNMINVSERLFNNYSAQQMENELREKGIIPPKMLSHFMNKAAELCSTCRTSGISPKSHKSMKIIHADEPFHGFCYQPIDEEGTIAKLLMSPHQLSTFQSLIKDPLEAIDDEIYWRHLCPYMNSSAPQGYFAANGVSYWLLAGTNIKDRDNPDPTSHGIHIIALKDNEISYSFADFNGNCPTAAVANLMDLAWNWSVCGVGANRQQNITDIEQIKLEQNVNWTGEFHRQLSERFPD